MKKVFVLLAAAWMLGSCSQPPKEAKEEPIKSTSAQTSVTMGGETIHTVGKLPEVGTEAPNFTLTANDMSDVSLVDFKGKNVILNIFPSLDTKTCSASVRKFNEKAAGLDSTIVLGISKDLPFASDRFCTTEGIKNVITLSDFRSDFGHQYGVQIADGKMKGLLSRAVVVINKEGKIVYEEQVSEISHEPNYDAALEALAL